MTQDNRSIGQVITETVADFQNLIRQQIDLTVAELKASAKSALMSSVYFVLAFIVLVIALILLVITVGFGIAAFGLTYWLAFLIDTLLFLVVAGVLAWMGMRRASRVKAPSRAADEIQQSINDITATVTGADE